MYCYKNTLIPLLNAFLQGLQIQPIPCDGLHLPHPQCSFDEPLLKDLYFSCDELAFIAIWHHFST